jgi:dolichol-phosphate mannosyltransferase
MLGYTVKGWATIMVCLIFFGGVQLICLGLMGEYIGRIFNEIKRRPIYIIEDIFNSNQEKPMNQDLASQTLLTDFNNHKV